MIAMTKPAVTERVKVPCSSTTVLVGLEVIVGGSLAGAAGAQIRTGEFVNGANELVYHGPNGGTITFVMSPMVFAGEAFILNASDWKRIGSTEPTFNIPGRGTLENPYMLLDVPDANALEFRRYFEQGVYCKRLARQTKITGIVNSSGPTGGGT